MRQFCPTTYNLFVLRWVIRHEMEEDRKKGARAHPILREAPRIATLLEENYCLGRIIDVNIFSRLGRCVIPVVAIEPFAVNHLLSRPILHFDIGAMAKSAV